MFGLRAVKVAMAVLLSVVAAPAGAQTPAGAQAPAADYLYVCNQSEASISVVDLGTLEIVKTIRLEELGLSPNAKPHHIVVEPDGSAWYVTLIGDNLILKFDAENELIGRAPFETPGLLALSPAQDQLYVGRSMTAVNPPHRLGVIDRRTMEIEEIDVVFPRPHMLDIRPSGDFVYTASLAQNQVASVEAASEDVSLVTLDGPPHAIAHSSMSPDGQTLVVTPHMPHLMIFDLTDPAKPALAGTVDVGDMPWHPVYGADGRTVYVPNQGSNNVTVVDVQARSVLATIEHDAFAEPYGSAISPDGRHVFIANSNTKGSWTAPGGNTSAPVGNVVVIDTRSNEVVKVLPVGRGPTGLGVRHAR
ncbi:MAG: YncE family protein [Longimicrobiales bacterium]